MFVARFEISRVLPHEEVDFMRNDEALQSVAISHSSANEEYWNISLKADVSLSLIGREKSNRILS